MERKIKYQYTHFIYPFIVEENKYDKYILKLMQDKKYKIYFFESEKDFELYSFFLPNIRENLFKSFNYNKIKKQELSKFKVETQTAILAKDPCVVFEYDIASDIQGKTQNKNGIFFNIQRIRDICFKTGICFLDIKTKIEETDNLSDVLNFNYKFREFNSDNFNLKDYENIKIQSDNFEDVKQFQDMICEITGKNFLANDLGIDTDKFLIYSYVCVDQENWNDKLDFSNIENEFYKFFNVLPSAYNFTINKDNKETEEVLSSFNYAKLGINKLGVCLFTSTYDLYNYTKLPIIYENEFLYMYILSLYQKIYLNKIENDMNHSKKFDKAMKAFIKFTKDLWIQEVTNDNFGEEIFRTYKQVAETMDLYEKIKKKYDVIYKQKNIENNVKINKLLLVLLGASVILNVLNFVALMILRR